MTAGLWFVTLIITAFRYLSNFHGYCPGPLLVRIEFVDWAPVFNEKKKCFEVSSELYLRENDKSKKKIQ